MFDAAMFLGVISFLMRSLEDAFNGKRLKEEREGSNPEDLKSLEDIAWRFFLLHVLTLAGSIILFLVYSTTILIGAVFK